MGKMGVAALKSYFFERFVVVRRCRKVQCEWNGETILVTQFARILEQVLPTKMRERVWRYAGQV